MSLPCSWLPPTFKNVPFAQIADIGFSVPDQRKKRRVWPEKHINDTPSTSKKRNITPSSLELDDFYKKLSESGKPVLLSLVPTYSKAYVPLYELGVLPKPLSDHFKEEYLELSNPDFLSQCESCYDGLTITASQSEAVEKKTKQQTGSRVWFQTSELSRSVSLVQ